MVELAEAHPTVGIVSAYRLEETRVSLHGLPYPSVCVPGREICRLVLRGALRVFGSPTSLLIRSDLIRKRPKFYDESTVSADTQVCFELLQECDLGFVHQVLTFTRRHNESMTSLTHKFNTRRLGKLVALIRYGPIFLDSNEYEACLSRAIDSYHAFLARCVFEQRDKSFWDYQSITLRELGYPIRPTKLAMASLRQLLHFGETVRHIRRAMGNKGPDTSPGNKPWNAVLSSMYE